MNGLINVKGSEYITALSVTNFQKQNWHKAE